MTRMLGISADYSPSLGLRLLTPAIFLPRPRSVGCRISAEVTREVPDPVPVGRRAPHRVRGGGADGRHRRDEPAALAAQRQLLDRRAARRRQSHDHRLRSRHLAQHHGQGRARSAVPPVLERLARRSLDVAARSEPGRVAQPRASSRGRLGTRRRHLDQAARPGLEPVGSHRLEALHRPRRRERGRRDGDGRAAAAAGAAGRHDLDRGEMDRARAADVRAHRRDRQLLLHRAVVPEARRPAGPGVELPSVPLGHRVLLRLRRLRRLADGAQGLGRRRHRRPARAPRQRGRHDHGALLPGGRPRLRVDDEPRLHRAHGAIRDATPAAGRDASAAAARARRPGRAPLRRHAHDAQVLRRVVRRLSVRAHHHRRSRVPERRRRDGYPTLFTAGTRWLVEPRRHDARGRHGPRGRPPVLVRHRRQQRVRRRVDGRGAQHVLDGAGRRAGLRSELPVAALLRRLRAVGVSRHRAQPRDRGQPAGRVPARPRRATRNPRRASGIFQAREARSPTTRRRCG